MWAAKAEVSATSVPTHNSNQLYTTNSPPNPMNNPRSECREGKRRVEAAEPCIDYFQNYYRIFVFVPINLFWVHPTDNIHSSEFNGSLLIRSDTHLNRHNLCCKWCRYVQVCLFIIIVYQRGASEFADCQINKPPFEIRFRYDAENFTRLITFS